VARIASTARAPQVRSFGVSQKIGRVCGQPFGDFRFNHPNRARLDVVVLPSGKLYHLVVEFLISFFSHRIPSVEAFFCAFADHWTPQS
jgi:hypothetical protein